MKGLRSRVLPLVLALLVVLGLTLPASAAVELPRERFYVQVVGYSPQRFLAGGDPNDMIEVEFSEPPGSLFFLLDKPVIDFAFPAGEKGEVRWEVEGTKLRVWSPGTGVPGAIIFPFEHIPWVRVAVAGDYMELTPVKFWGDGRVTLKARVLRWPGGPPAAGEEVQAEVVCRGDLGNVIKDGHMHGWPITLGVADRAKTNEDGIAYVTIQFYEQSNRVWLKVLEGIDKALDLQPNREAAIVVFTRRALSGLVTSLSFQAWERGESWPTDPKAPVETGAGANLPAKGPGGVSNPVLVTQDFLDRVFGKVRVVDTSETPPPTDNLPDGTLIDRQPGYAVLAKPVKLTRPGETIVLSYDPAALPDKQHQPAVYYWHPEAKKWVGLASYPAGQGKVKAVNRGYSGWFVVFGVVKPSFTDTAKHWAEGTANRSNVLGLLEGYPAEGKDPLTRPAGLDRKVTRAEFTTVVARILGLNPGDLMYTALKPLPETEKKRVLSQFKDPIPAWCQDAVAAAVAGGIAVVRGDKYNANEPLTRIEAAAIVSNALKQMPGWRAEDLAKFRDAKDVPSWAKGMIAEGVIGGYPDGTLKPNATVTRAEAMTLVLRLLEALGW
ncbi:MAG: S-layer homology domain-containing protein [Moorellales bacterium]